ncbi:hypothetical protein HID58_088268 [Brassica napus]|uniref:Uncharacterized protein n=1 Tax=Brassica napus TaxID=3708 RepID=A0ABQ7XXJ9_BRANA|nr:hypothetical protein HID58_088268 [Brassica napus]
MFTILDNKAILIEVSLIFNTKLPATELLKTSRNFGRTSSIRREARQLLSKNTRYSGKMVISDMKPSNCHKGREYNLNTPKAELHTAVKRAFLFDFGWHGKAWGIVHKDGLRAAEATKKISGVHKRCWKYIPNLSKTTPATASEAQAA